MLYSFWRLAAKRPGKNRRPVSPTALPAHPGWGLGLGGFVELTFMETSWWLGPELPQAWLRLGQGTQHN